MFFDSLMCVQDPGPGLEDDKHKRKSQATINGSGNAGNSFEY